MSRGGGSTVTTQTNTPWSKQIPFLEFGFNQARNVYDSGVPQFYEGKTYVPLSHDTEAALQLGRDRALSGNPAQHAANQEAFKTISGGYLGANPFLDDIYSRAANRVGSQVASAVAKAGRGGSGAHANLLGESLGNLATDIYGGNYAQERQNQLQTMQFAPQLAAADYNDINALQRIGGVRESQSQLELADSINRWNHAQQLPWNRLANYMGLISGGYGGTSTTTQPLQRSNPIAGAVGGAASGFLAAGWPGAIAGGIGGLMRS